MKAGILLGQLDDERNEAALVRTAEAMGINEVHVVGGTDVTRAPACGADNHVTTQHYGDYDEFVGTITNANHTLVAVEYTDTSRPVDTFTEWPTNPIFCVGNEGRGVPQPVVERADTVVHIEQSPNSYVRCLNATVAGSIVMHEWFCDMRDDGDMQQTEFERWGSGERQLDAVDGDLPLYIDHCTATFGVTD